MEYKIRYKTKIIYASEQMDIFKKNEAIRQCLSTLNKAINQFLENLEEFNEPKVSIDFCSWWDGFAIGVLNTPARGNPSANDCVAIATITYKVKIAI